MRLVDAGALRLELKELHRGRGIRRADVRTWLGPQLRHILGVHAATTEDDIRVALVHLIREHTARFPHDLRYLFLVASGIVTDHPLLDDRLGVASKALDRSPRVLRRRLRTAEHLLADSLIQTRSDGAGPFEDKGWQWEAHHFDVVLRDSAQLTLKRTLRALADHQKYIHEAFSIPRPLSNGMDLEFTGLAGVSVLDVEHPSSNSWGLTLELPHPLSRGQVLETELRVVVPDVRALSPFVALAPVRPSHRASFRVDFGTQPVAESCWVLEGALPADVVAQVPTKSVFDPRQHPIVTAEFTAPRIGLAYGIGWAWAD